MTGTSPGLGKGKGIHRLRRQWRVFVRSTAIRSGPSAALRVDAKKSKHGSREKCLGKITKN